MSILPDNVSWLAGLCELQFLSKEIFDIGKVCIGFAGLVVTLDSLCSLFILERDEDMHWCHETIKISELAFLVLIVLLFYYCSFKIVHFVPVHVRDGLSSFSEHGKEVWIVESNSHDGYFDFVLLYLVIEVGQPLEALLNLVSEPRLEANHGRIKLETVATLTDSLVLALAPRVVLIAFVTADAKVIAHFDPFLLLFRLVLIVELISNIDLNSVVT